MLFSYEDVGNDHVVISMHAPSEVVEASVSLALITLEMEITILNMEEA